MNEIDPTLIRCGFNNPQHVRAAVLRNYEFVGEELTEMLCKRIRQAYLDPGIDLELMIGTLPTKVQSLARQYASKIQHTYFPETL